MANWVLVKDGVVVERHDLLPEDVKSLTKEELLPLGWYPSQVVEPLGWDGMLSRITGPEFTIESDHVVETYTLVPLSEEEIMANKAAVESAMAAIALERNKNDSNGGVQGTPESGPYQNII